MINIFDIKPNKVTTNLNQYPMILMSETGDGKTTTMNKILNDLAEDGKKPLFIMFEDRFQHIPDIVAIRVHNMGELNQVKSQLLNPKAKEMFSCVVFDTVDRMDSLIEKYVADSKQVEITGDLGFGKGNKYIKSSAQFILEIKNAGWTTHFICQAFKNTNIMTQQTVYEPRVNKEIWSIISQDAYLCGFLKVKTNGDRVIAFKKTQELASLKNSLGMPNEVAVKDSFKDVLLKAVEEMAGGKLTDEATISPIIQDNRNFEEIKARGNALGGELAEAGFLNEAMFILAKNIGVNEDGSAKMFDSLIPAQIDLAEIVVQKLEELKAEKGLA